MTAGHEKARELAEALLVAAASGEQIPRPVDLDLPTARAVRALCIEGLTTGRGARVGAYKVSLSTGTWGALPEDAVLFGETVLPRRSFNDPLLEGEIAFLARSDLAPGCSVDEVLARCLVAPAIEVADSRWEDWCPSDPKRFVVPNAAEIEADNAVAGCLIIGQPWVAPDLDLADTSVEMQSRGQVLAKEPFRKVMGHPAKAVSWLAGQLAAEERTIRRGQIISSGCPHEKPVTVPIGGGRWSAAVAGLGTVSVEFV